MNRRNFLAILGAASLLSPVVATAQPTVRTRRVAALVLTADNALGRSLVAAFRERLEGLGWIVGRNLQIDVRWVGDDGRMTSSYAAEIVRTAPDVILAHGTAGITAVLQETHTIPTVFVQVTDPVASGFVTTLLRPGGNVTGVANFGPSIAGDRLRALKGIAPQLVRALLVHDRNYPTPPGLLRATELAATSLGVELVGTGARDVDEMKGQIRDFAPGPNGGLVVFPNPLARTHSQRIIALAAVHRLPAVYPLALYAEAGGLISYGVNTLATWQEAGSYVDRILRGANAGELPVQEPTQVDIVINLRTAKSLGLSIPPTLLAQARKVID
ncbi:MAG TPA: ABC transporter substrate-binding protein [Methylomirabilota bacterium]|nr:ABC transporter substrate-binding protein [Methylomirabilota bacterium]